jgi:hypothetical protein
VTLIECIIYLWEMGALDRRRGPKNQQHHEAGTTRF